jgi:formate dehydrogenase subunit gamma
MGEACQAVGARALRAQADTLVGPSCDVQSVFCLGNCALGPSAVVNGRLLGRVTGTALASAVSDERSGT